VNKTPHVTGMLSEWQGGNEAALERLMPVVYLELHRLASRLLRGERPGHTLQTTALIHEAFLKLVDLRDISWQNRAHFFAIAATQMRRILIDHARGKNREKRGGGVKVVPLEETMIVLGNEQKIDFIALDEALERLAKIDPRQVRIVELRYFSGLTLDETALVLNISRSTVAEEWAVAKAWLRRELTR
jgi:RNA polymerase sigma factor (TIGR02999 family)